MVDHGHGHPVATALHCWVSICEMIMIAIIYRGHVESQARTQTIPTAAINLHLPPILEYARTHARTCSAPVCVHINNADCMLETVHTHTPVSFTVYTHTHPCVCAVVPGGL